MATYRKTAKGLAEIATRANKLTPQFRAALILVDGRRTDSDLSTMLPKQATETLRWLTDSGFIEVSQSANASQWSASSLSNDTQSDMRASAPRVQPPAASKPIAQIQREAVRELMDQIGPMAEGLAMKIEKSRSREELKPLMEIAFQVLSNTRGSQAAQTFRAKHIDGL